MPNHFLSRHEDCTLKLVDFSTTTLFVMWGNNVIPYGNSLGLVLLDISVTGGQQIVHLTSTQVNNNSI